MRLLSAYLLAVLVTSSTAFQGLAPLCRRVKSSQLVRRVRSSPGSFYAKPGVMSTSRRGTLQSHATMTTRRASETGAEETPAPSASRGQSLWNLPNALTLARVVAIPLLVLVFYSKLASRAAWCSAIFIVAALTDWLDGYLARKWKITSPFGAFLDPVADKLMVATALILLTDRFASPLVTVSTAVIISREVGVSALREWMSSMQQRDVVAVGWWGKVKTASQMVAVSGLLMLQPPFSAAAEGGGVIALLGRYGLPVSLALLVVSAVLSITSASGYLKAAWPVLTGKGTS